jgi:hypothetical protein
MDEEWIMNSEELKRVTELFWIAIQCLPGEVEESNKHIQVRAASFWVEIWKQNLSSMKQ